LEVDIAYWVLANKLLYFIFCEINASARIL